MPEGATLSTSCCARPPWPMATGQASSVSAALTGRRSSVGYCFRFHSRLSSCLKLKIGIGHKRGEVVKLSIGIGHKRGDLEETTIQKTEEEAEW